MVRRSTVRIRFWLETTPVQADQEQPGGDRERRKLIARPAALRPSSA